MSEIERTLVELQVRLNTVIEITKTALTLLAAQLDGRVVDPRQVIELLKALDELTEE